MNEQKEQQIRVAIFELESATEDAAMAHVYKIHNIYQEHNYDQKLAARMAARKKVIELLEAEVNNR